MRTRLAALLVLGACISGVFFAESGSSRQSAGDSGVPADPYPVIPDPEFALPPSGTSQVEHMATGGDKIILLRSDGTIYATRLIDRNGRMVTTQFHDQNNSVFLVIEAAAPLGVRPRADGTRTLSSHVQCGSNPNANPHPWKWNSVMGWYWVQASTPSYLNLTNTLDGLRGARIEWENNVDYCGIADNSSMDFTYLGTIASSYGDNGINTVGWGSMSGTGCPSDAPACSRVETPNNVIVEADVRMNSAVTWVNGAAAGKFDVQSIFAHETGHNIGFAHIDNDSASVMYGGASFTNDITQRQLGRADANGNNNKY